MKTLIANLLLSGKMKTLNGEDIEGIITISSNMAVVEYINENVMTLGRDAKELIFAFLPLALRINISIHVVDLNDVVVSYKL